MHPTLAVDRLVDAIEVRSVPAILTARRFGGPGAVGVLVGCGMRVGSGSAAILPAGRIGDAANSALLFPTGVHLRLARTRMLLDVDAHRRVADDAKLGWK